MLHVIWRFKVILHDNKDTIIIIDYQQFIHERGFSSQCVQPTHPSNSRNIKIINKKYIYYLEKIGHQ